MARRVFKYNPAFLTDDELISSFVVRQMDLDMILQIIRDNNAPSNQHVLVVGPRGIGKTTLVLRVAAEVRRNRDFSDKWFPIVFGEESYEVSTPGEFWLEAIFHLAEQTGDVGWRRIFQELNGESDDARLRERALALLMDFADTMGKRLLIVAENFNMFIGEQLKDDDGWALRHTLLNEPRIMLLATAVTWMEEINNAGKPMFELFKVHDLPWLNQEECRALWKYHTGMDPLPQRIRPIQILTGGNPRLLNIIAAFAADLSLKQLLDELMNLVDEHTEYFKSRLDTLPPTERKVYLALAEIWDPATAGETARAARLNVNKTSALLKRLVDRGMVVVAEQKGRNKWYQVAERMYNIYYLMRRRGEPAARVRAVVNFMVSFYGPEELAEAASCIAREACTLDAAEREAHDLVLGGILEKAPDQSIPAIIIGLIQEQFFDFNGVSAITDIKFDKTRFEPLLNLNIEQTKKRLAEIKNPDYLAEEALLSKPKNSRGWFQFGRILETKLELYEQALAVYRKAVELNPESIFAWERLGQLSYFRLERYKEAEEAYRKIIEIEPNNTMAWLRLGWLFHDIFKRYVDAENAYRRVINIEPSNALAWALLGWLLHEKLCRYDEAEEAYKKAIEIKPNHTFSWVLRGWLLHNDLNRYQEAEEAYEKAIKINPNSAWVWLQLGQLLHEALANYKEAEEAYRRAINIKQDYARAWEQLGRLLHDKLKRFEDAEEAYRKAIEYEPQISRVWIFLGRLLEEELDRYDEAEDAYRNAIRLYEKIAPIAWTKIIQLKLETKTSKIEEILHLSEEVLCKYSENALMFSDVAWLIFQHVPDTNISQIEAWANKAVELEPEKAEYQLTLARILAVSGKADEALSYASTFLENHAFVEKNPDEIINLFIDIAAIGRPKEALDILQRSPSADIHEPLIVGLLLYMGEKVLPAFEILEVARDVKLRIEERQLELAKEKFQ